MGTYYIRPTEKFVTAGSQRLTEKLPEELVVLFFFASGLFYVSRELKNEWLDVLIYLCDLK